MQAKNGKGRDLEQVIYQTLREEILTLVLEPGIFLQESDLCVRFEASRTPVRTVLQRLSAEGLLEIIPYRGARVALIDVDVVKQTIFLRKCVEEKVLLEYMDKATVLDWEDINHNLRIEEILLSSESFRAEDFYRLDAALHSIWFEKTGNSYIWNLLQDLEVNYTRFRLLDLIERKQFGEIYNEHLEIFDLMKKRTGKRYQHSFAITSMEGCDD
jgi:Transcriptional regulators